MIENGNILQVIDWSGNKQKIGVTNEVYLELEKISNEYYNKLVELGVIVQPKTPEQIQAETMSIMRDMMEQMQTMKKELEGLKNDKSTINSTNDEVKPTGFDQTITSLAESAANSAGCRR
ncbi:MAG: hypothetical protein RR536_05650 [Anaerovoracaceae bacterium]